MEEPMTMFRRQLIGGLMGWVALATSASGQSNTGQEDPESTVRALLAAMEANDATRIRAAFAPAASQAYGDGAPKSGEAFSQWLQSDIIDQHGQVANASLAVKGNEVVVTGQYRNNAGYTNPANFLFKVSDGRIVSWQMRY
jgi:ketosteroid isomerase-like protein